MAWDIRVYVRNTKAPLSLGDNTKGKKSIFS